MAVYTLQPKLLSFNYSFSSISQTILSPLGQLHLYNSQCPHDDLSEEALPILPLVQAFPYRYLEHDHFSYAPGRQKGGNVGLAKHIDIETVIAENSEIIPYVQGNFPFES